jgi:ferric-dicitrate binding protein FerR (iron transport regulator)
MTETRRIIEAYIKSTHSKRSVRKDFAAWLADGQNKEEKDEILRELWNEMLPEADAFALKSFQKLQKRIRAHAARKGKKISLFRKLLRIAAIFLLSLSFFAGYLFWRNNHAAENVKWIECLVPKGETKTIILPDGSHVQLNAETLLLYPERFEKTRSVYIDGEGYFSVVHNEKQPFIVKTTEMEVEVLGTVFNVSSYSDSEVFTATLENGWVNVSINNRRDRKIELAPGEQFVYNRVSGTFKKQIADIDMEIAWIKGYLIIRKMSVEEIAKIIERKYAMNVYINSNRYENETITIKLMNNEGINEFMQVLKDLIPKLYYKIENNNLYIY